MFSGIRDSEMMSLETNCITHSLSSDQTTDIIWLHGTIYKTNQRAKKWIVPQVVERAVKVLSELSDDLRQELKCQILDSQRRITAPMTATALGVLAKRLHRAGKQSQKLFLTRSSKSPTDIAVLSGHMLNINLREFCKNHDIVSETGAPYHLHAHQFRRTYARFVARAELGDLVSLREHFGHASLDMTVYYTEGATDTCDVDTELLEMVAAEKSGRQNEIVSGLLMSDTPIANGTHWLKEWRSSVRTAVNKDELIAEFAGTLTLNGTGHSWCVGNAKGMGCGGLCVFEAQSCVDCHYGIIGPEHRAVWEGIRDQQLEALALDDIGPGGRERTLKILEYAEKVLRRLDTVAIA
jgi:hypothetical protein